MVASAGSKGVKIFRLFVDFDFIDRKFWWKLTNDFFFAYQNLKRGATILYMAVLVPFTSGFRKGGERVFPFRVAGVRVHGYADSVDGGRFQPADGERVAG